MFKSASILVFAIVFSPMSTACGQSTSPTQIGKTMKSNPCATVSKPPEWLGQSFADISNKWGQPLSDAEFDIDKFVITEFRGGLSTLKAEIKNKKGVSIRESTWALGDCRLTVWFKKTASEQTAVDTLYWHKEMEF